METENSNNKFKVLVGILTLLLIVLAVYTVTLYNDSKDTEAILVGQKDDIEQELEELIANYDEVIQENEIKDEQLLAARDRIEILLDSLKDADANVALLKRYKRQIRKLEDERVLLFKKADSLIAANELLTAERDNTYIELNETIKVVDSVTQENESMARTIEEGSIVSAVDLSSNAVIVRKSGKVVDTKRAKRANKVRACFTLVPNPIAQKGDRMLYVQVINPKNNLLGEKTELEFKQGTLTYSASTKVFYENEELDVCVMVDADEADLVSGRYTINVFDDSNLVATTTMTLK